MVIYSVHSQCFEEYVLEEQNLSACLPISLLSQSYVALCLKNDVFRITILFILRVDQSFCESLYLLNTARMTLSFFAIGLIKHCLFSFRYLQSPSTKKMVWPLFLGNGMCQSATGFFKDCSYASLGATGDTQVFSNIVFRH